MREAMNPSEGEWTPDSITHALPDSSLRMEFLRQLNTTPFAELEALGERWLQVINDLEDAVQRGQEAHAYQLQHGGELPPQYQDFTQMIIERQVA